MIVGSIPCVKTIMRPFFPFSLGYLAILTAISLTSVNYKQTKSNGRRPVLMLIYKSNYKFITNFSDPDFRQFKYTFTPE